MGDRAKKDSLKDLDRKLGDEWADWDGRNCEISSDTDSGVFVGLAFAAIAFLLGGIGFFGWLIYPRLKQLGELAGSLFNGAFYTIAAILLSWLILFVWAAITRRPFFSAYIAIPKLINFLLVLSINIARFFGVSRDRLFNSFLKLHNLILSSEPKTVLPERILLLLPRCLSREMNRAMRQLRDKYGILVALAGGGGEARRKIKELRPGIIVAVACERDLLTGFIEVNPHIPVIGFPNRRPCGPCKDTEVDIAEIDAAIRRHIKQAA